MRKCSVCLIGGCCFCCFLILTESAHAYIDPGTGSMIVQAVIAAIAAVSVSIGIFWGRLKSFFGRFFGRNEDERKRSDDS